MVFFKTASNSVIQKDSNQLAQPFEKLVKLHWKFAQVSLTAFEVENSDCVSD